MLFVLSSILFLLVFKHVWQPARISSPTLDEYFQTWYTSRIGTIAP